MCQITYTVSGVTIWREERKFLYKKPKVTFLKADPEKQQGLYPFISLVYTWLINGYYLIIGNGIIIPIDTLFSDTIQLSTLYVSQHGG